MIPRILTGVVLMIPLACQAQEPRLSKPDLLSKHDLPLLDDRPGATTSPAAFPFLGVDVKAKKLRVECEALHCENPLEFFCCSDGTNEHESVLRSKVKPSHLHAALLMLGLMPGEPVHFSESQIKWLPPHGPPLHISVEFEKNGKTITIPAYRLMLDLKTKKEMPPLTWIFAGSRIMENDVYAADRTGYIVSVVNFDLTVIDIPKLASSANETLEWGANLDVLPPKGSKVTMIIEPAGKLEAPDEVATSQPAARAPIDAPMIKIDAEGHIRLNDAPVDSVDALVTALRTRQESPGPVRVAVANPIEDNPTARQVINGLAAAQIRFLAIPQAEGGPTSRPMETSNDIADDDLIRRLRERWQRAVAPKAAALRDAAKTHYEVINQLRAEQQRLIDEADKIQRLIDQLEKEYQEMTTPAPAQSQ